MYIWWSADFRHCKQLQLPCYGLPLSVYGQTAGVCNIFPSALCALTIGLIYPLLWRYIDDIGGGDLAAPANNTNDLSSYYSSFMINFILL